MESIKTFPVGKYGELINNYMEIVSEYLKYAREVHDGPGYKARKRELEELLLQAGNAIRFLGMEEQKRHEAQETKYYFIPFNKAMHKIDLSKTMYIHSEARKVIFVQESGCNFEAYAKWGDVWEDVQSINDCFCRISKSYVVNLSYVDSFNNSGIRIGNQTFGTSKKYFQQNSGKTFIFQHCIQAP